jgi:GTP diphosphokinase / guanosine-3',5'-bis(diphosphate) 3'-diphosphatase
MVFKETDFTLILKALRFSAKKHRNQRRKDKEGTPYINHPIYVAETLWRVGNVRDGITITAAILHDTIEDTNATPEEIESLFGHEVISLVQEVSDDKRLPKEVRKRLQIETAPHKSIRAKEIKLADKICNVYDIGNSPPSGWPMQRRIEYLDWTERVVAGLRGTNKSLEDLYDEVLMEARKRLEEDSLEQKGE